MIEKLSYKIYSQIFDGSETLLLLYRTYKAKIELLIKSFEKNPNSEDYIAAKKEFKNSIIQ